MIRALSLAAVLALAPVFAAPAAAQQAPSAAEARLEAAAARFEKEMAAFGARAEAIQADKSLGADEQGRRIVLMWSDYQPHVAAFTAAATQQAGLIAQESLAEIDVAAIVAEAMVEVTPVIQGLAVNGAWAEPDPDHMVTYGLLAQYGMDLALDGLDEALDGLDLAVEGLEAARAAAPPPPPAPAA